VWRPAKITDDDTLVRLSLALYAEDPSPEPVHPEQIRRTLTTLRAEPTRGHPVVLELDGTVQGYALLISFWSNELGGEVCTIDELYVAPTARSRGHGSQIFADIRAGRLGFANAVALELEVTPKNARARALYQRLGFKSSNQTLRLIFTESPTESERPSTPQK